MYWNAIKIQFVLEFRMAHSIVEKLTTRIVLLFWAILSSLVTLTLAVAVIILVLQLKDPGGKYWPYFDLNWYITTKILKRLYFLLQSRPIAFLTQMKTINSYQLQGLEFSEKQL